MINFPFLELDQGYARESKIAFLCGDLVNKCFKFRGGSWEEIHPGFIIIVVVY